MSASVCYIYLCEADHSPPSSVEIKNVWRYTSTLSIRLDEVVLS
jgi:hypothetical protein